jgi:hypothetical protein
MVLGPANAGREPVLNRRQGARLTEGRSDFLLGSTAAMKQNASKYI